MPENHRILLAGSTHDGEEQLLASALPFLREKVPNLELVIVPRHAERGQEIANQLASLGFAPILKTALNRVESNSQQGSVEVVDPSVSKEKIWIANTTGELRAWYHLAEVVVIGKSFRGMGGQNPVEPILSGKPTVVGPHMQNFSEVVAELKSENGILQLDGDGALPDALEKLFDQPDESIAMAHRGAASMKRHRGAADRTVEFILT
tara:strand:- start:3400 stop:4020 length:621 start_codon:yes stop_codon:yes gene_type:complete